MDDVISERIRQLRRKYGIPTARKGEPLFTSSGDRVYAACILPGYNVRASGFKLAGDRLLDIVGKEASYQDHLVYPIVYSYRMYIELRLKEIINTATGEIGIGHNLLGLWEKAKPIMEDTSQWFDNGELDAVEEKLGEFCRIDAKSDAFRYPTTQKGEPTLQGMKEIDLKHLKKVVDSISTPLEGTSIALYEDQQSS